MSNIESVNQIYAAFFEGDADGILKHVSDDVEWEYGATQSGVPWIQPRRGHEGVLNFLKSLGGLEIHRLEPKRMLESDGLVIVLVDLQATVKDTGAPIVEEDEVHIWHFGDDGKVVRFRHRVDTLQHERAVAAESKALD